MIRKLINKYHAVATSAKAAFWFMICSAIQNGARFLAMPILVRLLTTEQYGIYSVFISWINVISVFATLKMDCGVFNNAMFRYSDSRDKYTSSAQSISIVFTIISFAVYLLFQNFWDKLFGLPTKLSLLIFAQLLFTEGFLVWSAKQRYEYKYINLLTATAVFSLLCAVAPITAGYFAPLEKRLAAVICAGVAIQILFGLCFIVFNFVKGKSFFNKEYWGFAIKFNIPLIPHYLSGIILGQADRVMIKSIVGASEAGIYSFTYNISLVMNIVTNSINNAIIPHTYNKLKSRDFNNLRSIINFILILIAVLTVMFSLAAPELIKIFATAEYYEAIYLVPIISLSSYFQFVYCLFGNIEFFFEKNKFITIASVIGAIANIVLNAVLIPRFGYFAAGYTTLFCYVLFSLAHYFFSQIICKEKLNGARVYNHKTMLIISITAVTVSLVMLLIYDYWYIRYGILALVLVFAFLKRINIINKIKMIKEK